MMLVFAILLGLVISIPFFIWSSLAFWIIIPMSIFIAIAACFIFGFIVDWIEGPQNAKYLENHRQDQNGHGLKPSAIKFSKKTPCPDCKESKVADILYGMISVTPKLQKDIDGKKVILGGCMIYDGAPQWHCFNCKKDYGKLSL